MTEDVVSWLRRQPDRCNWCGHHPTLQGHRDTCPTRTRGTAK